MSEWKETTIGEISDVVGGGTPSTSNEEYWEGDIPWLTPRDLTTHKGVEISKGERSITQTGLDNSSARLMPEGTVLVTSRAPIGYVAIASNPISTNQGFKSLIPKEGVVDGEFLYYWVKNNVEYLEANGSGTTFSEISGTVVKQLEISLPPHAEQRKISKILRSLDDKIDLLHRQNQTLEQMAETVFRQWFVENPNPEWEERPLSSIATFLNGLACQKYPPQNDVDKLPVLKIKELRNGITEDCDWCTTEVDEKYIVENGDVIFSWSASLMVKIWDGETCILNQHLFKVTSEEFPKWYFYLWSKFLLDQFIAIARAHATTMGHIKRGDLDEAMVLVPSEDEIDQMSVDFEPILEKTIENNNQIRTLTALRDTLLPKLMSGEVRV